MYLNQIKTEFFEPSKYFYAHILHLSDIDAYRLFMEMYIDHIGLGQLNGLQVLPVSVTKNIVTVASLQLRLEFTYWLQRSSKCSVVNRLIQMVNKYSPLNVNRDQLQEYFLSIREIDPFSSTTNINFSLDKLRILFRMVVGWNAQESLSLLKKMQFFSSLLKAYNIRGKICDWGDIMVGLVRKKVIRAKDQLKYYIHGIFLSLVWTYPFDTTIKYTLPFSQVEATSNSMNHLMAMWKEDWSYKPCLERSKTEEELAALEYAEILIKQLCL